MTPQEKAIDLFNKMKGFRVKHTHSKRCAKVAVDEILTIHGSHLHQDYWQEVKKEIEKL